MVIIFTDRDLIPNAKKKHILDVRIADFRGSYFDMICRSDLVLFRREGGEYVVLKDKFSLLDNDPPATLPEKIAWFFELKDQELKVGREGTTFDYEQFINRLVG